MQSDIEIAQHAEMRPIGEIAEKIGIRAEELENYGPYKAKVSLALTKRVKDQPEGKLILVTAFLRRLPARGRRLRPSASGRRSRSLGKKS